MPWRNAHRMADSREEPLWLCRSAQSAPCAELLIRVQGKALPLASKARISRPTGSLDEPHALFSPLLLNQHRLFRFLFRRVGQWPAIHEKTNAPTHRADIRPPWTPEIL